MLLSLYIHVNLKKQLLLELKLVWTLIPSVDLLCLLLFTSVNQLHFCSLLAIILTNIFGCLSTPSYYFCNLNCSYIKMFSSLRTFLLFFSSTFQWFYMFFRILKFIIENLWEECLNARVFVRDRLVSDVERLNISKHGTDNATMWSVITCFTFWLVTHER